MSTDESVKRYTRSNNVENSRNVGKSMPTEEEIKKYSTEFRRLPREKRTVIGPNGEQIYIPRHMSVKDIYTLLGAEFGLSVAEISGIFMVLKQVSNNPEFCGKINRVVAQGINEPIKIVRPQQENVDYIYQVPLHVEPAPARRTETKIRAPQVERYLNTEELYRQKEVEVNQGIAERTRSHAAQRKQYDEERQAQNENLRKQMQESRKLSKEEEKKINRVALKAISIAAALYMTGLIAVVASTAKQAMTPEPSLTPLTITETDPTKTFGNGGAAVAETLEATFPPIGTATPAPTIQGTPAATTKTITPSDVQYEPFLIKSPTISDVSEGLNPNSRLYKTLQEYTTGSLNPVVIGDIDSYQEFEALLKSGDPTLYTWGPTYFESFSRQVVQSMIKDRYNTDRISATYEKKGEGNSTYEFYIRYYTGSNREPFSMEGHVDMKRNEKGRLETDEYHTFSMEVYETLALIGEFSNYRNKNGTFNWEKYAMDYTNGDIQAAKTEVRDKMNYGTDCVRTIIESRARNDKIEEYTTGR